MRFIHMADMHFDTPFTFLNSKEDLGNIRRLEQRQVFKEIIEYIKLNKIPYFFICGDLYEHQYVKESTIEFINNLFKDIPETKIFITPGNHDPILKKSFYNNYNWNNNVYIFNSDIGIYEFSDVDIYGFGFDDFYFNKNLIGKIKIKNKNKINILLTHGTLNGSAIGDINYNSMSESTLKSLEFDYVALGHIHKKDIKNNIVYPGSTISLGFDELGEHGILDVNLNKDFLNLNFIPFDKTSFEEINLDISEIKTEDELIEKINNLKLNKNNYYKLIFFGINLFEININKILKINTQKNILKIKNETKSNIDIKKIMKQNNLKSYFVSETLNPENGNFFTEEDLKKVLEIGLNALGN